MDSPPLVAALQLDIGADINNRDGSLTFSAVDMYIGGALDAAGQAIGRGSVLNNLSASIESLGDMSIGTGTYQQLRHPSRHRADARQVLASTP